MARQLSHFHTLVQVYADSSKCRPVLFLLPSERGCDPKFNSVKGQMLSHVNVMPTHSACYLLLIRQQPSNEWKVGI